MSHSSEYTVPTVANSAADETASPWPSRWTRVLSLFVAFLLLATAALKLTSPRATAALKAVYEIPSWLITVVVHIELLVASFLLFGGNVRKTLSVVATLFAGFGAFAAYRAWAGYESCGCFGPLKVRPLWTMGFDFAMAVVAAIASRSAPRYSYAAAGIQRSISSYALLGIAATAWMTYRGPLASTAEIGATDNGLVVLEPASWPGQPLPVADRIEPTADLSSGSWIVLFFHHDCPECQAALPKYDALAGRLDGRREGPHILLVEVPPFGKEPWLAEFAALSRLPDNVDWFIQAPVEVRIDDGVVTSSSLELPAVAP